jgi:hypothetical protein
MSRHALALRLTKLEAKRPEEAAMFTFPAPDVAWWKDFARIVLEGGADGVMVLEALGMSEIDLAALGASVQETPDVL